MKHTARIKFSTDPSVKAVRPAINENQEALAELQTLVSTLVWKVAELEDKVERVEYP